MAQIFVLIIRKNVQNIQYSRKKTKTFIHFPAVEFHYKTFKTSKLLVKVTDGKKYNKKNRYIL